MHRQGGILVAGVAEIPWTGLPGPQTSEASVVVLAQLAVWIYGDGGYMDHVFGCDDQASVVVLAQLAVWIYGYGGYMDHVFGCDDCSDKVAKTGTPLLDGGDMHCGANGGATGFWQGEEKRVGSVA